MGSSDSIASSPLVSLALGYEVNLWDLNAVECVQLLRGYIAHLQPSHKFLPAKSADEITSHVRPLIERDRNLAKDHVFWQPVKRQGVGIKEKCVDLGAIVHVHNAGLRDAHADSGPMLYWTRSGALAILTSYYALEVGGTVAYDFVALTDLHLLDYFDTSNSDIVRLTRKRLFQIINNAQRIVETMVASREADAQKQRVLADTATKVCSNLFVTQTA